MSVALAPAMTRYLLLTSIAALTACQGVGTFGETWETIDDGQQPGEPDQAGDDEPSRPVEPGEDEPVQPDEGAPDDPCGGLDETGECLDGSAFYCVNGRLLEDACLDRGQVCGLVDGLGSRCVDEEEPVEPEPEPVEPDGGSGALCSDPVVVQELALTNEARRNNGLGELACDEGLAQAATLHSQDMCDNDYFSHGSRDGRSFEDRISAQEVSYQTAGENIAWGQTSPEEVHRTWMNSWGHRANILGRSYGRIGIGYVACNGSPYWTQDFTD